MKKIRKLLSLVLAMIMVLAMAMPALADYTNEETEAGYVITINDADKGHTYTAYQVFKGTVAAEPIYGADGTTITGYDRILSDITWGDDVNVSALIDDLQEEFPATAENATVKIPVDDEDGEPTAAEIAKALAAAADKSAEAKQIAKIIQDNLKADAIGVSADAVTTTTTVDEETIKTTTATITIAKDKAGYYLVTDKVANTSGEGDEEVSQIISSLILQIVGNVDITPKTIDRPDSDKKILEDVESDDDDETEGGEDLEENDEEEDAKVTEVVTTDKQVGDSVTFQLKATVDDISDYDTYKLVFNDTMSVGLTYDSNSLKATLKTSDGTEYTIANNEYTPVHSEVKDAGNKVTGYLLTITFADITSLKVDGSNDEITVLDGDAIIITYDATLNKDALTTGVATNNLTLTYSNNPNSNSTATTTPDKDDEVKVYTHKINVVKVNGDTAVKNEETGEVMYPDKLSGAKFVVYKEVEAESPATGEGDEGGTEGETGGSESNTTVKKYLKVDASTKEITWLDEAEKENATVYETGSEGTITIEGLSDGTYFVEEKEVPAGFNKVDAAQDVVIEAGATDAGAVKNPNDVIVINYSGATLPSTGGIGTTVFYAAGIILMAGAVFFVVRRKRA